MTVIEIVFSVIGIGTVSYTHLDVYKRQDVNHSNSGKKSKEQIRIVKEVMHNRQVSSEIQKTDNRQGEFFGANG